MDGNSFVSDVPISQEINLSLSSVSCPSPTSVTPLPQLNTLNTISVNDAKDNESNCYCSHGNDDDDHQQIMSHLTATNTSDYNLQFNSTGIINGKEDVFNLSENLNFQNDQINNVLIKQKTEQQQQQQQQVTSKLNSPDFTCAYNCSKLKLHFTSQHSTSLPTFSSDHQIITATATTANKLEPNNSTNGNNDTGTLIPNRVITSLGDYLKMDKGTLHLSPCHGFNAMGDNLPRVKVTSVDDEIENRVRGGQVWSENVPKFKLDDADNENNSKSDTLKGDFWFRTLSSTDVTSDELKCTSVPVDNGHGHLLLGNSSSKGSNYNNNSNNSDNNNNSYISKSGHCTRCNKIRGKHLAHYKSDSCINCSCSS